MIGPKCDHLIPTFETYLQNEDESLSDCVLKKDHEGMHLGLSRGRYVEWEMDLSCGCEEEDCQCFLYRFVGRREALKRILRDG
jgi:hypothetical protein